MKTDIKDYVICGLLLTLIASMSAGLTFFVSNTVFSWIPLNEYGAVAGTAFFLLFYGLLSGVTIRILIKFYPLKEGHFAMESSTFSLWKIFIILSQLGNTSLAPFNLVFLRPLYAALYGAKMGKNVALAETMYDAYMVEIGDDTIIGCNTYVYGNYLENNKIFIGKVKIGHDVMIGVNCTIFPNTVIGDGATLSIGSVVMPGTVIPAGETWKGNPARKWQ